MWFKNLYIYQFEKEAFRGSLDIFKLNEDLSSKPFIPCSPTQRKSSGWVPPYGKSTADAEAAVAGTFTRVVNGFILLTMVTQERILPATVIREQLNERVAEIEEKESRKLGAQEKRELTERIEDELLPKAFTRTTKLDAWIDVKDQRIVINTMSSNAAEYFTTLLRKTIGSLPITPLMTESAGTVLKNWLSTHTLPESLEFGEECELKGTGEDRSVVSFRCYDLSDAIVEDSATDCKTVSKLALSWNKKISFTLGEDLIIKKLRFMGVLTETLEQQDPKTHEEAMDIEFTLMSAEVALLLNDLLPNFGSNNHLTTKKV